MLLLNKDTVFIWLLFPFLLNIAIEAVFKSASIEKCETTLCAFGKKVVVPLVGSQAVVVMRFDTGQIIL